MFQRRMSNKKLVWQRVAVHAQLSVKFHKLIYSNSAEKMWKGKTHSKVVIFIYLKLIV